MVGVVVFPGQGSQRAGMGLDFAERHAAARAVFEEASAALELDVAGICAGDDRLGRTEYAQPCILTAEIAMLAALRAGFGFDAQRFGGHSLGEYSALVAAGALPLADAVKLVRVRGRLMQDAVPVGRGGMIAVIQTSLDIDAVAAIARGCGLDVANYNSPSQVVLSGENEGLAQATPLVQELGARVVALEVSAPFHSRLLRGVEPEFAAALEGVRPSLSADCATAVTSNFTGALHEGAADAVVAALLRQITGSVRWIDNMQVLAAGADRIIELGPNKPLSKFFKEIGHDVTPILNVRGAEKVLA
jgi:malonyl CoA-acyl carrier protein transacylase